MLFLLSLRFSASSEFASSRWFGFGHRAMITRSITRLPVSASSEVIFKLRSALSLYHDLPTA